MPKHRFVQFIAYMVLTLVLCSSVLYAQPDQWYRLVVDENINELEKLRSQGKITDPDWKNFVEIIFIEKSDDALPAYIKLYDKTSDSRLKKLILDRISQYYYARGFYETANRILDEESFRERIFSVKKKSIQFGVQLGAFASYQNALRLKHKFSGKISDISIITKNSHGQTLYVVVAGKLDNHQEAEKLKRSIKQDFGHKGIVIQY